MNFNSHFDLVGRHALLSASKYHWTNYDDDKFEVHLTTHQLAQRGTELHALAAELIRLKIKLPRNTQTINAYVNDALGYRMTPEQVLMYSYNCFGTADAISFHKEKLRIHDLKTGTSKANFRQLEIYAAMFCLEYAIKPAQIGMEFRIYQSDDFEIMEGDPDEITHIMDKIIRFDKRVTQRSLEVI
jgi:hypothetical protein